MKHAFVALAAVALSLPVPAQSWLTNGLVAHYRFDGNAIDVSGNNANGTPSNVAFSLDRFSASYRAARFAGPGSYIAINSTNWNLAPEFSVSVWFKFFAEGTENPRIVSAAGFELVTQTTAASRRIAFNNTTLSSGATVESSNSVLASVWTHALGVRASNEIIIYINGALAGRTPISKPPDYSRGLPEIGGNFAMGSMRLRVLSMICEFIVAHFQPVRFGSYFKKNPRRPEV
jgi:hypothetical protein